MSNDITTNPSSHTAAVRKQSDCNLQGFGIVRETTETTAALTHRPSKRRFSTSDNQNGVAPHSQEAAAPHYVRKQVAAPQPHQTLTRRRSFSSNGAAAAAAAEQQGGLRSNASSTELAAVVSSRGSSTTTPPRRSASSASVKPRHVNTAERIFPSEGTSFGESETPRRPTSATPRPSNGPTPSKTLAMWATGAVEEGQAATATPRSSRRCYHNNNHTHTNAGDQQQSPSAAANLPAEFDLKALTGGRQKAAQVPGASEGPFPRGDEASEASSINNKNVAGGVHVRPMIRPKDMCRSTGPENELQPVRRLARRCADQHYHNTLHFLDNPRRPSN